VKRTFGLTLLTVVAIIAAACGGGTAPGGAKPKVVVGSTNFYEQLTLGELYAQVLEANGYTVERKFNLGNREIVQPALQSGQIDVLAEYLATLAFFLDPNAKATSDAAGTERVLKPLLEAKGLTLLRSAEATDQNGFVVTKATADRLRLSKISDLAPHARDLVLGGPPECPQRPFCALGLRDKYGITFKEFKPLDVGGPLTVAALEGNQIQVALLFTSDPSIAAKGLVLLQDDKGLQLADNIAPVVRTKLLEDDPGDTIERLLNSVSEKLSQAELTALNKEVAVDKKDSKDVAAAWLRKHGLIK
jgi:osmoprotectant transport system substrate-binding protein